MNRCRRPKDTILDREVVSVEVDEPAPPKRAGREGASPHRGVPQEADRTTLRVFRVETGEIQIVEDRPGVDMNALGGCDEIAIRHFERVASSDVQAWRREHLREVPSLPMERGARVMVEQFRRLMTVRQIEGHIGYQRKAGFAVLNQAVGICVVVPIEERHRRQIVALGALVNDTRPAKIPPHVDILEIVAADASALDTEAEL